MGDRRGSDRRSGTDVRRDERPQHRALPFTERERRGRAFRIGDDNAVNLSVWETPEALEHYVFKTVHVQFYKKRALWFDLMEKPHMVFWWVEEGHQPALQEALDRLEYYEKNGASEYALGWAEVIDKERWHAQRCA
jgi:hypothetical protein